MQYSHLPSPGQSFPKVNAGYLNLLVFSAEMQQVQYSCDDHGRTLKPLRSSCGRYSHAIPA